MAYFKENDSYENLQIHIHYGEIITEYLTNYMCFLALSVEIFSILFSHGMAKNITTVLFVDTAVFAGLLIVGFRKP